MMALAAAQHTVSQTVADARAWASGGAGPRTRSRAGVRAAQLAGQNRLRKVRGKDSLAAALMWQGHPDEVAATVVSHSSCGRAASRTARRGENAVINKKSMFIYLHVYLMQQEGFCLHKLLNE